MIAITEPQNQTQKAIITLGHCIIGVAREDDLSKKMLWIRVNLDEKLEMNAQSLLLKVSFAQLNDARVTS